MSAPEIPQPGTVKWIDLTAENAEEIRDFCSADESLRLCLAKGGALIASRRAGAGFASFKIQLGLSLRFHGNTRNDQANAWGGTHVR